MPWTEAYQAPPSMGFSKARVLEWGAIASSEFCLALTKDCFMEQLLHLMCSSIFKIAINVSILVIISWYPAYEKEKN